MEPISGPQRDSLDAGAVYYGFDTVEHGDYIIGCEKLRDTLEIIDQMLKDQQAESEPYIPADSEFDYEGALLMEAAKRGVLFTVRLYGEIVGDVMFLFHTDEHEKGVDNASDHGFYLMPAHRTGWLANKLLTYATDTLSQLGISSVYMGDKAPLGGPDLSSLFKRAGFKPISRTYLKRL